MSARPSRLSRGFSRRGSHARFRAGREFRAIAHRRLEDVSPRRRFGDLIYALPAIRALGGGALYLSEAHPGREPLTAARRDVLLPLLERIDPLFEALAKEIDLEGLHLGEDGYVCLVTESGLHIHFQQEDESLLSICELGRLATDEGRMEMLETLLAANALWEGTKGATLSLEPTSDKVLLARKRTINELVSPAP